MSEPMVPLNIAVLTVSDTRTEETDRSGQALVERLTSAGHTLAEKRIVPDDVYRIRAVVANWIAEADVQVVITTGGTGFTGRDSTPEAISVLLDKRIEGFGERFRQLSGEEIGSSTIQSRCLGGLANATVVFLIYSRYQPRLKRYWQASAHSTQRVSRWKPPVDVCWPRPSPPSWMCHPSIIARWTATPCAPLMRGSGCRSVNALPLARRRNRLCLEAARVFLPARRCPWGQIL